MSEPVRERVGVQRLTEASLLLEQLQAALLDLMHALHFGFQRRHFLFTPLRLELSALRALFFCLSERYFLCRHLRFTPLLLTALRSDALHGLERSFFLRATRVLRRLLCADRRSVLLHPFEDVEVVLERIFELFLLLLPIEIVGLVQR